MKEFLSSFKNIDCNVTVKMHYLINHLHQFPPNLGAFSDEQGEKFHQDVLPHEIRYKGKDLTHMLADYVWMLSNDNAEM